MYTGIIEEVEAVSLQMYGAIVGDRFHDFPLGHAGLQQRVVHSNGNAIFATEIHVRRDLRLERQMAHLMVGHQNIVYPLDNTKPRINSLRFTRSCNAQTILSAIHNILKYYVTLIQYHCANDTFIAFLFETSLEILN